MTKEMIIINKYSDEILALIDMQLRNDENSLTQSDLQSVSETIIRNVIREVKE